MPGLAHSNDQFSNGSSAAYSFSANGFWSKNRDDVSYNQLQKFWSELSPQARLELLRIDKQTLFEQARKNMYCSRCNGLLLEGFIQIVMYGKSLQREGAGMQLSSNNAGVMKNQSNGGLSISNGSQGQDEIQDPSVHPWGGLTTTRDGSLTLMECYLYSKSLKGLQTVFDGAHARERERELLYPDACGGGGRGWISQGIVSYGRGHGTRETCALHTARLSCDTLVDFWSALGEETWQSLLRMKEEDFIERLMFRFGSKRFCRDCRRNVIREFKELKELKRLHRETRCTHWFCVADTAFQYQVSDDSIQADWRQTFADSSGSYHHFEWAVGTSEGKSDILDFENVGINGCVQVSGLDLVGLNACFITLRAWKVDGCCTELSVKAQALKGQQCVHCRLIVGDGYVTITKGESIRRFFEHAEEAEEDEDDDSVDKDGNELDGECSRPQKHAKSPELAREFLLDAATVIFKEQVEKAFREGTARQNAHGIFVCLALKLLEERVHVACKEIITLEKQMRLLEEEEKEKREEEERKERRRTKEREKKLRRKERLKGKEKDKEKKCSKSNDFSGSSEVSREKFSLSADGEQNDSICCSESVIGAVEADPLRAESLKIHNEEFSGECNTLRIEDQAYDVYDEKIVTEVQRSGDSTVERSKLSCTRLRSKDQMDMSMKRSDRHHYAVVSENGVIADRSDPRSYGASFGTSSRGVNGSHRQLRINAPRSNIRSGGPKYNDKFHYSNNRMNDKYDYSCRCYLNNEYRIKVGEHSPVAKGSWEKKPLSKSEFSVDTFKQFYCGNKFSQVDYIHESCGRPKSRIISGDNPSKDLLQPKKVWGLLESQKKYPLSNSDSDVSLRTSTLNVQGVLSTNNVSKSVVGDSGKVDDEDSNLKGSSGMNEGCQDDLHAAAERFSSSIEVACEDSGLCQIRNSVLNGSDDPNQSCSSNSDNCSSCLSEGDSNRTDSNHENLESSTTSDSEAVSQQYEGREGPTSIQNDLSDCHGIGMEKVQSTNGEGLASRSLFGPSSNGAETDLSVNPGMEIPNNYDNMCSQPQSMLTPLPNQNIEFSVFQAPSTVGYFLHNPVSWTATPTNSLMSFPYPNHFFYGTPLGYSLNEDPHFCLQYGALQQPTLLFNPAIVPVYHPVARAKGLNAEECTQISKLVSMQEQHKESTAKKVASGGANSRLAEVNGEVGPDHFAMSQVNNNNFSLFHFGGPVALSKGCKFSSASSNGVPVENICSKCLADHVEKDHACHKETTNMEEYNLFAANNSISFSIF